MVPIIEISNLSCKIGQNYLLHDINWKVMPGENWVVYGLNGSGKTTLLSAIAGYRQFDGVLKIFGETYSNENILEIRKKIGWVSSSFFDKQYTKESVLDIILSGKFGTLGVEYDITLNDVIKAKKIARELGIAERINYSYDMLSKGQRQNVLIARALISEPELLILDEPCGGLDVYNRAYLFSSIRKLSIERNITVIYVTHYTEEIIDIFEYSLLLQNGRIFTKGKTTEVFSNEMLEKFLGYKVHVEPEQDGAQKLVVEAESRIMDLF